MTGVTPHRRVKPGAEPAEPLGVGPEQTRLRRTTACPSCGSVVRPEATWCSLCFGDLRPAAAAAAVPAESEAVASLQAPPYGVVDPLTASLLDLVLPRTSPAAPLVTPLRTPVVEVSPDDPLGTSAATPACWPCDRCGESNGLAATMCLTCGAPFLAHAADRPSLVVPGVGDLLEMSRGRRAGLAVAAVAALLLPLALVTLLLTGRPPSGGTPPTSRTTVTNAP